ncbi:YceD family protein [Anaerocolumna chitinilytica]|uniref:DUF177 domain-containing protein n=1 Tax=Anaerocolumna chitinilytica TaxID=1727145 RepID=A0A7I8DRH2_9FIRM|nr:DUF177 domain-containing protein [Anaerocolumna chitinilytica]BCK00278.1 hypothetical protein bsdcttw_33180 [Anaerocolumna chitinilytica]
MIINLSEIMSVKGNVVSVQAPIEAENFCMEGESYPFVKKEPVDLKITHLGDRKVKLEGRSEVSLLIPCSRCLKDVTIPLNLEFSKELDFMKDSEERIKELDETNYISGYNLDVDLLVYDEILIDFPMKVLCDENCKGFCKVCGSDLNKGECSCEKQVLDPRMSVIRDIFNNFKEV